MSARPTFIARPFERRIEFGHTQVMSKVHFLAAAGLLAVASRVSGEGLGEVAARERERRTEAQRKTAPARVLTEEDLKTTTGRIANDPTIAPLSGLVSEPAVAVGRRPKEGAENDLRLREAHWREVAQRRRREAERADQALKAVERWSDPTYAGKDVPSCPIVRGQMRSRARADAASAREALKALDEEARVAGALPGWIRE